MGTLQSENIVFESEISIKLTDLENAIRPIRQQDIMLNNYVFVKHENTLSLTCLNESLLVLDIKAISCTSLQILKINYAVMLTRGLAELCEPTIVKDESSGAQKGDNTKNLIKSLVICFISNLTSWLSKASSWTSQSNNLSYEVVIGSQLVS